MSRVLFSPRAQAPGPEAAQARKDRTLTYQATAATRTAAPGLSAAHAPAQGHPGAIGSDALRDVILSSLEDDKAEDVIAIPLAGKSEMADHMVICSGRSSRQVAALAEKLTDRLKQDHGVPSRAEGLETGDWVLIDAGDVIVHIFRPEVRDFYQLEKMWMAPSARGA